MLGFGATVWFGWLTALAGTAGFPCSPGNLAVYRLELRTFWSEERFPKQYPQWRPPAQWSKTIGFVHSAELELFHVGRTVGAGLRRFVENGDSELIEQEFGNMSSLDTILAPPILQGEGATTANIFVDGNHTKVSLVTKIVPSPDWFIGLDSLDLCRDGEFIDQISLEVDPLDAGTDNGFTFTSPNWPTEPQGVVFKISSSYPPHPAGSFNYPHLHSLPTLAIFSFQKEKDYQLSAVHHAEMETFISERKEINQHKYKYDVPSRTTKPLEIIQFVPYEETTRMTFDDDVETNEVVVVAPSEEEEDNKGTIRLGSKVGPGGPKPKLGFRTAAAEGYHSSTAPEDFFKKKYKSEYLSQAEDVVYTRDLTKLSTNKKKDMLQNILDSYQDKSEDGLKGGAKKKVRKEGAKQRRSKKPRNCEVSEWTEWSSCSKTCGIGESIRTRTILKHPRHGGSVCPKLRDYKWCGSARNCHNGYFNW